MAAENEEAITHGKQIIHEDYRRMTSVHTNSVHKEPSSRSSYWQ